jgi:peptidoglycan/xylan/chitin deacetylase (PgdA/CDA1 family)
MRSVWLAYHDIYDTAPAPGLPQSATMYHVSKATFTRQLAAIEASGRRTITASECLNASTKDAVVLTFDDGWRGAFEMALPLLQAMGWKATFFVTRDFVGRQGFCDPSMILKAAEAGMEIGVHGTTHRMLSSCSREEIMWEFTSCKGFLESMLNREIDLASVPGGGWDRSIVKCAKQAGLRGLCTSRPGINTTKTSPFNLRRVTIRATTADADLMRYCCYRMQKESARWALFQIPRSLLGMRNYTYVRRLLLGEGGERGREIFEP